MYLLSTMAISGIYVKKLWGVNQLCRNVGMVFLEINESISPGDSLQGVTLSNLSLQKIIGFLRGGVPRGGGNWGTLRIPREDWGSLGNIRED